MKSSKPQESGPEQHSRFIETARALGCDEDKEKFEDVLGTIAQFKPPPKLAKGPKVKKSKPAQ
jgi:hypothetical protein